MRVQRVWYTEKYHGVVSHPYQPDLAAWRTGQRWSVPLTDKNCSWQPVLHWQESVYRAPPGPYHNDFAHRAAPLVELVHPCTLHRLLLPNETELLARVKRPVVLYVTGDDNWGHLSTEFPNRTVSWGLFEENLAYEDCGLAQRFANGSLSRPWCTPADIVALLDRPQVLALFHMGHTNMTHRKLFNVPLGTDFDELFRRYRYDRQAMLAPLTERRPRPRLLDNANSDWGPRNATNAMLLRNLGLPNVVTNGTFRDFQRRLLEVKMRVLRARRWLRWRRSHRVAPRRMLSPSGMGADTFRNMEILVAGGTVPVMERGMGLERAWSKLPVVWVNEYSELTWPYLRQAWAEIIYNGPHYDFAHLTQRFWHHDVLERLCATGDASFLEDEFPMPLPQFTHRRYYPAALWWTCWSEVHPQRNNTLVRRCKRGDKVDDLLYKEWTMVA